MVKIYLYQAWIDFNMGNILLVVAESLNQARSFAAEEKSWSPQEIKIERVGTMETGQAGILAELKK